MTIGERAVEAIRARVKPGQTLKEELDRLDMTYETLKRWTCYNMNPSAYFLQQMVLNGYDIYYILTGERKHE